MSLHQIAAAMNNDLARQSSMRIGAIVRHPDGYDVKVVDGCFLDPVYGRVSNFWYWHRVQDDGSLGPKEHGYGW